MNVIKSGLSQLLFRNGTISIEQLRKMTSDDVRQLDKSTIAYLSPPVYSDKVTAITWGGFRIQDISSPLIAFCVTDANALLVANVTSNFITYFVNFTTIQLDTGM